MSPWPFLYSNRGFCMQYMRLNRGQILLQSHVLNRHQPSFPLHCSSRILCQVVPFLRRSGCALQQSHLSPLTLQVRTANSAVKRKTLTCVTACLTRTGLHSWNPGALPGEGECWNFQWPSQSEERKQQLDLGPVRGQGAAQSSATKQVWRKATPPGAGWEEVTGR